MSSKDSVSRIRRFNRFYTKQIGVLQEGLLQSPYSLAEARVLYELAHTPDLTASQIGDSLALDPGYLSRILKKFRKHGLVEKRKAPNDGRQTLLSLTRDGYGVFHSLDEGSQSAVADMVECLTSGERARLLDCMSEIEHLLGEPSEEPVYVFRPPFPGELGWVVSRHGELYSEEFGWGPRFEGLVARVVAEFAATHDPATEACWIAESGGRASGSVMLVREDDGVARLRLLLVEPRERGKGLGRRLVSHCLEFARRVGYKRVVLWTQSVLTSARKIYESSGFEKVKSETHTLFGPELEGETWALELKS